MIPPKPKSWARQFADDELEKAFDYLLKHPEQRIVTSASHRAAEAVAKRIVQLSDELVRLMALHHRSARDEVAIIQGQIFRLPSIVREFRPDQAEVVTRPPSRVPES